VNCHNPEVKMSPQSVVPTQKFVPMKQLSSAAPANELGASDL
jgi:hypothetical protein